MSSTTVNDQIAKTSKTATAKARFVRVTPRKARRVVDIIRGKDASEALDILRWAPQAASEPIFKVLSSAIANAAHNQNIDPRTLVVSKAFVDEGSTMKRIRPHAHGRAYRIRKRTSHITIEVESIAAKKPATRGRRKGA